ncbi:hypothetical protein PUN28_002625 [Cardiocondyla obscurior]|uniref:Uncharacterized protein n=1 Tax=Cardiocondyla obscurior TaxID=286306 RepID=A0AAW2GV64_9HYME
MSRGVKNLHPLLEEARNGASSRHRLSRDKREPRNILSTIRHSLGTVKSLRPPADTRRKISAILLLRSYQLNKRREIIPPPASLHFYRAVRTYPPKLRNIVLRNIEEIIKTASRKVSFQKFALYIRKVPLIYVCLLLIIMECK